MAYKTGEFLKEVSSHITFYNGQEKCDCLIEVNAWTDLAVLYNLSFEHY